MKIAVITCYDQNEYVRARNLRVAFAAADGVETLVIKNKHKGMLRYIEVPLRILWARATQHLDGYVITFRGYEMLLFLRLTGARKPIVFDELVNFVEYYQEHGKIKPDTWKYHVAQRFWHWNLKGAKLILADTQAHAELSATLSTTPLEKYRVFPIGLEEELFYPEAAKKSAKPKSFNVFYYGNGMTPLHGLKYILEAAVQLKDHPEITFSIFGGRKNATGPCAEAVKQGAHLTYEPWIQHTDIPHAAITAGLCLGGPFGKTLQSQYVTTGKTVQFLACAAPVLVGDNKVNAMFKDKQNCLTVPLADTPAIVAAVLWASKHSAELARIGKQGRALYEKHFSQAVLNGIVQGIVQEL